LLPLLLNQLVEENTFLRHLGLVFDQQAEELGAGVP
jgi:hypothetical protein